MILHLTGKPLKAYSEAPGTYQLQNFYANELPVWKQTLGKHAVWYSEPYGHWCISKSRDLGSENFMISGPSKVKSYPNNILESWSYYHDNYLLIDDEKDIEFTSKRKFLM